MTNLTPAATFDDVQQLETTTVALGGPGAPMNVQAQALLNRTQYLYVQLNNLAAVATTGDYNRLINRPALGSAAYQPSSAFATAAQGAKADGAAQASALSAVAFSGSYNDLIGKPFPADAPSDSNTYGRRNGSWVVVAGGAVLTNPMTTAGDIIVAGTSGTPARLGAGSVGQVLGVIGTGALGWVSGSSSSPQPYYGAQFGDADAPHGFKLTKKGVIISPGASGSWKESRVESPSVFWDPLIGKYRMVFLGYSGTPSAPNQASIGYATADSPDGPWTEYTSNPVFGPTNVSGDPDQNGTSGPFVWFEDGTYYLFYIGLTATGLEQGTKTICLATSTDFVTWTRHGAVITTAAGTWRAAAVWHPNIVKRGSTYYLFFNAGDGGNSGLHESIGYATSSDLLTWTVDDANSPVLDNSGSGWDSVRVGDPYVYRKGDVWYMAYYANNGTISQDGIAYTSDASFPLGWQKFSGNPVLAVGASGSYDDTDAARPAIFVTPTRHYHFYTTSDGSSPALVQIAYAVDDSLNPGGIPEAPADGAYYARQNGAWASFTPGGGGGGSGFVGCRAHRTSSFAASSTSTAISFDANDIDTNSIHSTSTNPTRFTVPTGKGGVWRLSFHASVTAGSGINYLFIRKNGGTDTNNIPGSTAGLPSQNTAIVMSLLTQLTAGDYVELFGYSNSSATMGSSTDTGLQLAFEAEFLG